jgi:hypothetical protein
MTWLLVAALGWVLLALPVGLLIGRGIGIADRRAAPAPWTDEVERFLREQTPVP